MIIFDVRSLSRGYNIAKNCECKKLYIDFTQDLFGLCNYYVKCM